MNKKLFGLLFGVILVVSFFIRLIPAQGNNFFFTTDQGQDAVYAREIWERGQVLLRGPETNIQGIFAGPGWYYFISLGYKLFNGHPFGALFMVILLSLATITLLFWQFSKNISLQTAILVGLFLLVFWPFYDTSRYAFNPFPLVFLAVLEMLFLVGFLQGKRNNYFWAIIPVLLAFNTEVAGAAALFLFYLAFGAWAVAVKRLSFRVFGVFAVVISVILTAGIGKQFLTAVKDNQGSALGTFSGTSFIETLKNFARILQSSVIPQNLWASLVLFTAVIFNFLKTTQRNSFKKHFVTLSLSLFLTSYLFFSTNKGWRDWHTIYLPTLLFISFILAAASAFPRKIAVVVLGAVFLAQAVFFRDRYLEYLNPSDNPSILANQLKVLDWIYQNREGDGFNAYTYIADDDHDYPYQYLFWWYGRKRYGFVPCEYQNYPYPITSKHTYVPGALFYTQPTLGCDKFRFLIIEDDRDIDTQRDWLEKVSGGTNLLEEKQIDHIRVQKRSTIAF